MVFERNVVAFGSVGVAEPGSVDVEPSSVFLGHIVDGRELLCAVHRAEFGGEGEIYQLRLNDVVAAAVGPVCAEDLFQFVRPYLSVVVMGKGDYFVSGEFNCAGFVHVDVAGRGGYGTLPGLEQGVDDSGVGLRASNQEKDVGVGVRAGFADALFGAFAVFVNAVCAGIFVVCLLKSLQDCGVHPAVIIAIEIKHILLKIEMLI